MIWAAVCDRPLVSILENTAIMEGKSEGVREVSLISCSHGSGLLSSSCNGVWASPPRALPNRDSVDAGEGATFCGVLMVAAD